MLDISWWHFQLISNSKNTARIQPDQEYYNYNNWSRGAFPKPRVGPFGPSHSKTQGSWYYSETNSKRAMSKNLISFWSILIPSTLLLISLKFAPVLKSSTYSELLHAILICVAFHKANNFHWSCTIEILDVKTQVFDIERKIIWQPWCKFSF